MISFIMEWIYKYFSLTAVIAGLWFLIKYLIQKKIDSYFNTKLENHKKEIAIITENAKYDISKKLFDFEAYASKKHVVYPELYSIAFELWVELKMFRSGFDRDHKDSKVDMEKGALESSFYEKMLPISEKLHTAYDYFYKNELYLSKNAATAYDEAIHDQVSFMTKIVVSFHTNLDNDRWQDPDFLLIGVDQEYFHNAKEKMTVLKEIIYKELSYTHSEEVE